jgi:hypothetical protein
MHVYDQHWNYPKRSRDLVGISRQTACRQLKALLVAEVFDDHLLLKYQVVGNYDTANLHPVLSAMSASCTMTDTDEEANSCKFSLFPDLAS